MSFYLGVFVFAGIYGILAMSFTLVHGMAGMFTVAQAVFFGVGAYGAALLGQVLPPSLMIFGVLAAILLAALLSIPIAVVALRERGQYMMLVTFSTQIIFSVTLLNVAALGGDNGIGGIPPLQIGGAVARDPVAALIVVYLLAGLVWLLLRYLEVSALGRLLRAIREDEFAAEALGANVWLAKFFAFVASAGLAGFAGALFAHYSGYINPASFSFEVAILVVTISVLGGQYSMLGAVLGALVIVWLPYLIGFLGIESMQIAAITQVIYGGLIVAVLYFRPSGMIVEHRARFRPLAASRAAGAP